MTTGITLAIALTFVCGGYVLGSLSFAVLVSRVMGLADPRTYGSNNPGATNVLRSGNRAAALITLLGDAVKGAAAVWLANRFAPEFGLGPFTVAVTGLAAFVGHLYPVFFRFRGGKGVATFFGVLTSLQPWLALFAATVWLVVAIFFRYSSLASITAAALAPFFCALVFSGDNGFGGTLAVILVMSVLLVSRHQKNLANLMAGNERKIGAARAAAPPKAHGEGTHKDKSTPVA